MPKKTGDHPVVIIIHGGCWLENFADLKNTSALATALTDLGYATWNIEYRRTDNTGGGFPGTFLDIANAADHLRNIASAYSLDLSSVIVIGHSAGGHLALWLAARQSIPPSSSLYKENPLKVRKVISMGGVVDLKNFQQQGKDMCGSDVITRLLGQKNIEQRYNETSPINLLPFDAEQILIYGTDDPIQNPSIDTYIDKARKAGNKIQKFEVKHVGHHGYNVPNSLVWPVLLSSLKIKL